jgi:hypothetical protein
MDVVVRRDTTIAHTPPLAACRWEHLRCANRRKSSDKIKDKIKKVLHNFSRRVSSAGFKSLISQGIADSCSGPGCAIIISRPLVSC